MEYKFFCCSLFIPYVVKKLIPKKNAATENTETLKLVSYELEKLEYSEKANQTLLELSYMRTKYLLQHFQ